MSEQQGFDSLAVVLQAQNVEEKDVDLPSSTDNFNLIRPLGIFRVLDASGKPLSQPSAVRLVATYTADDVSAVPANESLLLGIWFDETALLWTSQVPVYPANSPFTNYWQGSGWFTFEIPDPDPEGGEFTLYISGNLSDPVVGVGSG